MWSFFSALTRCLSPWLSLALVLDLCAVGVEGLCLPLSHLVPGPFPLPWLGFDLAELAGVVGRHAMATWRLWWRVLVLIVVLSGATAVALKGVMIVLELG